ncbi:MAG: hypothetical protein F4Z73_08970 [Synechococcus sp. SB0668_bin_13]|uniref:Uncharacterized protein n=1 Tax=Synechococcus sp. SB0676_bin_10 TaxID=2604869 RepID=A0A6B1FCV2_9SYNE|nr:hypothetical protein [Synechococcus sp. SB0668_bin_13]MYG38813.1 hypothetical protein [Synechococcus sp. SB0676_bin_10]MYG63741.1 hypothetical protein [Synechococcus sp. SB0675_bin_7]MYK07248.1 hypothetical protein [Synechococcus sp. SB0670_bin_20]MYK85073.1 hypothetical protein [Synechococcus sp. SB0669_bin_7]
MVAFSLNDRIDDGKTGADDHPRQCRARRCLGYVGQDAALDKTLTGREMLHLHGTPYHLSRDSTQHRVVEPDAPAVLEAPTAPSPWAPACWCWLAWRDCYFSPSVPSCAGGWVDAATTVGASRGGVGQSPPAEARFQQRQPRLAFHA